MTKTTTVNAIPYPEDTDAPNGPAQMKAMAELLDALKWPARNLKPTFGGDDGGEAGTLTLTEAFQSVGGVSATFTPAVTSRVLVLARFQFWVGNEGGAANIRASGVLRLDSTDQDTSRPATLSSVTSSAGGNEGVAWQLYRLNAVSAAEHTLTLRAKKETTITPGAAIAGQAYCRQAQSGLIYLIFAE